MLNICCYILLLVTLIGFNISVSGQITAYNDGEALTISSGITVTIKGNYTNKTNGSLGTISNAGTITLTGDWTNNSANTVFSSNDGTVQFIGTAAGQTIAGTNSTRFYNLTTNNTFGTSPQITLGINTDIKNTLTMTAGNTNLAGFTLTLGTAAASPGTLSHGGVATNGWMYGGNFTRYFNTTTISNGNVAGMFPMGNSTGDFRPFYVSCPSTAPTTGGTITTSHTNVGGSPATVSFVDNPTATLVVVRTNSYFTASTGGGLAGGTYNLRGEGTSFGMVGDVTDLRLTLVGSTEGTDGGSAGSTSNPQVNRTGLTLANLSNNFYIGSIDAVQSPLPIELLSFDANCNNNSIIFKWSTATETNNDFFTIEHGADGITFMPIGTVKGAGNSSTIKNYSFIDNKLETGTIFYYRLKQTDFDGKFEYSDIIAVKNCRDGLPELIIYPNPNNGIFMVESSENKYELIITNVFGEKLFSQKTQDEKSGIVIDLSNHPSGIYFLHIKTNEGTATKKLIIQK